MCRLLSGAMALILAWVSLYGSQSFIRYMVKPATNMVGAPAAGIRLQTRLVAAEKASNIHVHEGITEDNNTVYLKVPINAL